MYVLKLMFFFLLQGHDEEAVVDMGKISSTINTNFEKEELESEFGVFLFNIYIFCLKIKYLFSFKCNQYC